MGHFSARSLPKVDLLTFPNDKIKQQEIIFYSSSCHKKLNRNSNNGGSQISTPDENKVRKINYLLHKRQGAIVDMCPKEGWWGGMHEKTSLWISLWILEFSELEQGPLNKRGQIESSDTGMGTLNEKDTDNIWDFFLPRCGVLMWLGMAFKAATKCFDGLRDFVDDLFIGNIRERITHWNACVLEAHLLIVGGFGGSMNGEISLCCRKEGHAGPHPSIMRSRQLLQRKGDSRDGWARIDAAFKSISTIGMASTEMAVMV
ncbi:hypothetical protein CEXT_256571 [Caerostris extrusa]|uniref:Uncharacterized protein n=1 Tax=Caerostris extrusa TaxID=172846 RepID=A0AAV4RBM7_CAEEX|nr:hypothetical protein CEXT_256571 [Caerostris extrusa]